MMNEHTPGPLTIHGPSDGLGPYDDGGDYGIIDADGKIIGEVICQVDHDEYRPSRENALLWAASPDLFIVCIAVAARPTEAIEMMRREGFVIDDLDDRWQKLAFTLYTMLATNAAEADAAIAKARGETDGE